VIARLRNRWARRDERGLTLIELLISSTLTLVICGLVGTLLFTSRGSVDSLTARAEARQASRDLVDGALGQLRDAKPQAQCVRYEDYDASRPTGSLRRCLEQREVGGAMLAAEKDMFCFLANKDPQASLSGAIPAPDAVCVDARGGKLQVKTYARDSTSAYVNRTVGADVKNSDAKQTDRTPIPSSYSSNGTPASTRYIGKVPAGTTQVFKYGLVPAGVPGEVVSDTGLVWSFAPTTSLDRIVAVRTELTVEIPRTTSAQQDVGKFEGDKYRLFVETAVRAPQYAVDARAVADDDRTAGYAASGTTGVRQ